MREQCLIERSYRISRFIVETERGEWGDVGGCVWEEHEMKEYFLSIILEDGNARARSADIKDDNRIYWVVAKYRGLMFMEGIECFFRGLREFEFFKICREIIRYVFVDILQTSEGLSMEVIREYLFNVSFEDPLIYIEVARVELDQENECLLERE